MADNRRLIDANAAISKLEDELFMCKPVSMDDGYLEEYKKRVIPKLLRNVIDWIKNQPTVDAVEVVHGRWERYWSEEYWTHFHSCSVCLAPALTKEETMHDEVLSNYCPNCGAKMDGDGNG